MKKSLVQIALNPAHISTAIPKPGFQVPELSLVLLSRYRKPYRNLVMSNRRDILHNPLFRDIFISLKKKLNTLFLRKKTGELL